MVFRNGEAEEFKTIFDSSKNLIRHVDGCRMLRLLRSGNVFITYSEWENEAHLESYRNSELFKQTWAKTKVLFEKPAEAWTCNAEDVG